jgi:UDP-3-O-[3-hydroxymyristoyl] glucosamine N-acyltransferase
MKFNNRNIYISPSAKIGENVRIGDGTAIFDNVIIGMIALSVMIA